MNRMRLMITALILALTASLSLACQMFGRESVSESHIRANVPDAKDFDPFFKRDLETFFANPGKVVTVDYELLQDNPSQVAVSSPKFYAWVKVYENGSLIEEGAVRVGAVERKQFVVINYMTREEITRDPERMHYLFPKTAASNIEKRLGNVE